MDIVVQRLDVDLLDVVIAIEELSILVLNIPVAKLVADQVLLTNAQGREQAALVVVRSGVRILCVVVERPRHGRAWCCDLVDVLDRPVGGRLRHGGRDECC